MLVGSAVATSAAPLPANTSVGHAVTLVTGERVMLSRSVTDVPTAAIVRTADSGPAAQLKVVTLRGHTYVIPASAMAYLGRTLDPQLFDVTAMQHAGYGDRIPLAITFKPGTKPSLPGVTFTKIGARTARAYVTQDSARTFGAALADQAITDSLAGWPATDALFGSVTGIAPVFPAPGGVTPDFPQSTLIIDGISKTGGPMRFAFGVLFNAEDGGSSAGSSSWSTARPGERAARHVHRPVRRLRVRCRRERDGPRDRGDRLRRHGAPRPHGDRFARRDDDPLAHDAETLDRPGSLDVGHDKRRCTPLHVRRGLGARERRDDPLHTDAAADGRNAPPRHPVDQDRPFDARWRLRVRRFVLGPGDPADQSRTLGGPAAAFTVDSTYGATAPLALGGAGRFIFVPHSNFASATYYLTPFPLHRVEYVYAPRGSPRAEPDAGRRVRARPRLHGRAARPVRPRHDDAGALVRAAVQARRASGGPDLAVRGLLRLRLPPAGWCSFRT